MYKEVEACHRTKDLNLFKKDTLPSKRQFSIIVSLYVVTQCSSARHPIRTGTLETSI